MILKKTFKNFHKIGNWKCLTCYLFYRLAKILAKSFGVTILNMIFANMIAMAGSDV